MMRVEAPVSEVQKFSLEEAHSVLSFLRMEYDITGSQKAADEAARILKVIGDFTDRNRARKGQVIVKSGEVWEVKC